MTVGSHLLAELEVEIASDDAADTRERVDRNVLAVYRFRLAERAMALELWEESLTHFKQAIAGRPTGWPSSFFVGFRCALSFADPGAATRLRREMDAAWSGRPEILVGQKEVVGWDSPVVVDADPGLIAITLRNPVALELGMPVTVDWYWADSARSTRRTTTVVENVVPNSEFEILAQRQRPSGWTWKPDDLVHLGSCGTQIGRKSSRVVLEPAGAQTSSAVSTRLMLLPRDTGTLLWTACTETSAGGNPHMLVSLV